MASARPFKVGVLGASLGNAARVRHFKSEAAAIAFAETQAKASWYSNVWTVLNRDTGERTFVHGPHFLPS